MKAEGDCQGLGVGAWQSVSRGRVSISEDEKALETDGRMSAQQCERT